MSESPWNDEQGEYLRARVTANLFLEGTCHTVRTLAVYRFLVAIFADLQWYRPFLCPVMVEKQ